MKLPQMSDRSMMRPAVRTSFGGLNHNLSAGDGEIFWMENMSSREYPLLTQRPKRGVLMELDEPYGMGAQDEPFWVDGTGFYYDGVWKGSVSKSRKQFAVMGSMVLIFPDKKYYDFKAGVFGNLALGQSYSGVSFQNGTYIGVPAEANTIYKQGAAWTIAAGDAIAISGCTVHTENNKTAIVREVEGDYLRFYEGTFTLDSTIRYTAPVEGLQAGTYHFEEGGQFTLPSDLSEGDTLTWNGTSIDAVIGGVSSTIPVTAGEDGEILVFADIPTDYTETGTVTLGREVPDLDYICVNENRLWGCKGDTIYASALGDPFNFNVFDGLSTDSWQSDTTDAGDFTACYSFQGYPLFFKEDSVFKVQGDNARNFAWTRTDRLGVKAGCDHSLAVAGETLFYLSRVGVCAYQGGMPRVISDPLGANTKWSDAVGGSDGIRYYVSMTNEDDGYSLFAFDTRYGIWHREDVSVAVSFAFWDGGLHMLTEDGTIWRLDGAEGSLEDEISWEVKFADSVRYFETSDANSQNKKGLSRLMLRCELAEGATVTVSVSYDKGSWHEAATIRGADGTPWSSGGSKMFSYNVPLILRRCDSYRIKLTGTGESVIYSLTEVKYSGSNLQGGALYKGE